MLFCCNAQALVLAQALALAFSQALALYLVLTLTMALAVALTSTCTINEIFSRLSSCRPVKLYEVRSFRKPLSSLIGKYFVFYPYIPNSSTNFSFAKFRFKGKRHSYVSNPHRFV